MENQASETEVEEEIRPLPRQTLGRTRVLCTVAILSIEKDHPDQHVQLPRPFS
jgi:hypothetical protein